MIRFLIASALRLSGPGATSIRRIAKSTLECDAYPSLSATSRAAYPNARLASQEATDRPPPNRGTLPAPHCLAASMAGRRHRAGREAPGIAILWWPSGGCSAHTPNSAGFSTRNDCREAAGQAMASVRRTGESKGNFRTSQTWTATEWFSIRVITPRPTEPRPSIRLMSAPSANRRIGRRGGPATPEAPPRRTSGLDTEKRSSLTRPL